MFADPDVTIVVRIYEAETGANITHKVQTFAGYMPETVRAREASLGALIGLRAIDETPKTYRMKRSNTFHIYVIGQSDEPIHYSLVPGRMGLSHTLDITLDSYTE